MSITFMAKYNEREGSLVPHPPVAAQGLRRRRGFERFVAGQLACLRELTLLYAPNINSYKRFASALVRPHRGRLGPRQPHLRGARRRPRRLAPAGAAPARRRRQPVPGAGGDDRRRRCTGSTPSSSSRSRSTATPTRPTSRTCRRRCSEAARAVRGSRASRARRSARRSSRTTSTTPGSSSTRSTRPSPTGSEYGGSSGCDRRTRLFAPVQSTDRVRGDAGAAGHRDQARPARARHAPAGRARAVRAARDRPLDAAPGADRAGAVRPPARGPRPRRRDVRGRARRRARRPTPSCSPTGATRCDPRLAVELGVAVLAAERAEPEAIERLDELVAAMAEQLDDFDGLPAGRRALPHRARRGDRLAGAGGGDDRGPGRDDRPDPPHRPPARGARVVQRPARAAGRLPASGTTRRSALRIMAEHLRGTEHVLAGLLP